MCNLHKIGWLMVLSGIILTGIASIPVWALTAEELLNNGLAAADQKNYAAAKPLLMEVVSTYPQNKVAARAAWRLGDIAREEKKPDQARSYFQWVVDNHPNSFKAPDALLDLASLDRLKKPLDSVNTLTRLIQQYPESYQAKVARLRIANIWVNRREYPRAIEFAKAVLDDPGSKPELLASASIIKVDGHLGMWRVRRDLEHLALGIKLLEEVAVKYPEEGKAITISQIALAEYFSAAYTEVTDEHLRRDNEKARDILRGALANHPNDKFTWWLKSMIMGSYVAESRFQEAVTECELLLSQSPPPSWKDYFL